jgi:hypothetical protein
MDRGHDVAPYVTAEPLPLRWHALSEPVIALVLIVAPFALGFADITEALVVSVVAGLLVLLQAVTTRWPWAPLRLVPLGVHAMNDTLLGVLVLAAPFVLEYHDDSTAAWIVHAAIGAGLIGATWATDWRVREAPLPPSRAGVGR